ncbi:MAG: hypothetical protein NT154_16410 [Verrucomicrobia bacterium]|nr:hypothetical protein [Verrucomicrobiota bacterium]
MNNRKRFSWVAMVGGVLILAALVLSIGIPNYVGRSRSETLAIVSNLRQLDGAMQQWAYEHGKTGAVVITEQDVAPYLRGSLKPVAGERYILKTLTESPEAQLTHEVEGRPKGSVLRLNDDSTFDVILPNKSLHSTPR